MRVITALGAIVLVLLITNEAMPMTQLLQNLPLFVTHTLFLELYFFLLPYPNILGFISFQVSCG